MSPDVQSAEAWLMEFRGRTGKCAELETCLSRLADIESEIPVPGCGSSSLHVSGGGISDPTASAAAFISASRKRLHEEARTLQDEIADAGTCLMSCPHGGAIDAYYLQPDERITWSAIAAEYGVSLRTVWRWRNEALVWLGTVKPWMMHRSI